MIIPPFFSSAKCQAGVLCVAYAIGIPPTWYLLMLWFLSHCHAACSTGQYVTFSTLAMIGAIFWPVMSPLVILEFMARAIWG